MPTGSGTRQLQSNPRAVCILEVMGVDLQAPSTFPRLGLCLGIGLGDVAFAPRVSEGLHAAGDCFPLFCQALDKLKCG